MSSLKGEELQVPGGRHDELPSAELSDFELGRVVGGGVPSTGVGGVGGFKAGEPIEVRRGKGGGIEYYRAGRQVDIITTLRGNRIALRTPLE